MQSKEPYNHNIDLQPEVLFDMAFRKWIDKIIEETREDNEDR